MLQGRAGFLSGFDCRNYAQLRSCERDGMEHRGAHHRVSWPYYVQASHTQGFGAYEKQPGSAVLGMLKKIARVPGIATSNSVLPVFTIFHYLSPSFTILLSLFLLTIF